MDVIEGVAHIFKIRCSNVFKCSLGLTFYIEVCQYSPVGEVIVLSISFEFHVKLHEIITHNLNEWSS
jgi:hypothetical protein